MESKIISRENIKPFSPTPAHLKTYKLSMLDQIMEPVLIPIALYFPPPSDKDNISDESYISQTTQHLKHSLSLILTRFYVLAGRVNEDGQSIDCDDSGVHLTVTKFPGCRLSDLLRNPSNDLPSHLLSGEATWDVKMDYQSFVLLIQINYFDCGSIAIGANFWHKAADAVAMVNFLKAWGSANRGSKEGVCPNYIAQLLFPHKEAFGNDRLAQQAIWNTGKWVRRRYVFDSSAITSLQAKSGLENSTRVECISTLFWKCFMKASLKNGKSASVVFHAVNLRGRARPPFPSDCFGNWVGSAVASSRNRDEVEAGDLARKLRNAINDVDDGYVTRMQSDGGLQGLLENIRSCFSECIDGADVLCFSSWCRFGIYDIDFGWGKPVWTTAYCNTDNDLETSQYMNLIWLMDSRNGDGIEASVTLSQEYMAVFDAIQELRDLACIETSPLDIGPGRQ